MGRTIGGALIGLVCTLIFYFIPPVNSVAPFLGGLLGGYYADGGLGGGFKSGILMTIFMIIPGFLLGGILGVVLRNAPVLGVVLRNAPVLEGFVAVSALIVTVVIVAHTAIIGIIGSVIGALLAERRTG